MLCDVVIVNSCTVTNGADSDVRNYINKMNRSNKKILLTGCGAISKGREFLDNGSVFGVFGMSQKEKIQTFLSAPSRFYEPGNLNSVEKNIIKNYQKHTKAFVKIQEGCDFNCSYCIIPAVRGNSRSMDEKNIINEVKTLCENGFCEIVLTGTNIGSYGKDTNSTLSKLLQKLGIIPGLKRIRLGSIEPSQIDVGFKEILREGWLERHLHIALQHTSQKMLTIMRRRNKAFKDLELFAELSDMGFALGTDFIVGHPGETEEIWKEAFENFKKFPLTHLHAFAYSPRDGTHSAKMKFDVNKKDAKVRMSALKEIVLANNFEFRKKHYNTLEILVEDRSGEFFEGYDQFYNKIQILSQEDISKQWLEVKGYEIRPQANFVKF